MATVTLPYSLTAGSSENVNQLNSNLNALVTGVNGIDTAQINDGQVTTAKIQDGTIVNADVSSSAAIAYSKLNLANSVVTADLTASSVTTAKIADSSVTSAKIADATIVTGDLADSSVTSAKIVDGTIVAADLAASSVTAAKIATSSWTDYSSSLVMATDSFATNLLSSGNATWSAAYQRIQNTVFYRAKVTIGATFGFGIGNFYTFNLPVAASTTNGDLVGSWQLTTNVSSIGNVFHQGVCFTNPYALGTSRIAFRSPFDLDASTPGSTYSQGAAAKTYSGAYNGLLNPARPSVGGVEVGSILVVNLQYEA